MKRTLNTVMTAVLMMAFAVACTSTEASVLSSDVGDSVVTTEAVSTPSNTPAQLVLADLSAGMEVCAHQQNQRWDAEIVDIYDHDGINFVTVREHKPAGTEDNSAVAAGYGLEASSVGEIGSTTRLSAGHCTETNNLGDDPASPVTNEPFVLNFDEAGIGMQVCVDRGGIGVNGVITNLYFEDEAEMVSVDIEGGDPLISEMTAVHMTLGYCS